MTTSDTINEAMARKGFMPATDAATRAGVHVSTIYRAVDRGAVEGFTAGDSGLRFVRRASLAAFYGPEVSAALGLDVPLPGEASTRPRSAPKAPKGTKTAAAPKTARKGPSRAAKGSGRAR